MEGIGQPGSQGTDRLVACCPSMPRSKGVLRSTSPVTSAEPSSKNDGLSSSTISNPASSSATLLVVGSSNG